VKAFLCVAESNSQGEIYNVGAGNPQSLNKLVELIGGEVIYLPKRPGEPECTWADISKIKNNLNWNPIISFNKGVQEMLAKIDNWKDAPLWDVNSIDEATKTWFQFME